MLMFDLSLNCVPDIEAVVKFNAKQICNVMAAWMMYRRIYGCNKDMTRRTDFVVWAPNKRMRVFLQHLTKWKVFEQLPSEKFFYFGVNPTKRELMEVSAVAKEASKKTQAALDVVVNQIEENDGVPIVAEAVKPPVLDVIGGIIVGSDPHFLNKVDPMLFGDHTVEDSCILGPQKYVTSF